MIITKPLPLVVFFCIRNNRSEVALVKNPSNNNRQKPAGWGLVGGCGLFGETAIKTGFRKANEEAGIGIHELQVYNDTEMPDRERNRRSDRIRFFYLADFVGEPRLLQPQVGQEVKEARWVNEEEMDNGYVDGLIIYNSHLRFARQLLSNPRHPRHFSPAPTI